MKMKYDLVGVDGNAFMLMGYTARALRNEGLGNLVSEMQSKAMSGDYNTVIITCLEYVDRANEAAKASGYVSDDAEDDDDDDESEWEY